MLTPYEASKLPVGTPVIIEGAYYASGIGIIVDPKDKLGFCRIKLLTGKMAGKIHAAHYSLKEVSVIEPNDERLP